MSIRFDEIILLVESGHVPVRGSASLALTPWGAFCPPPLLQLGHAESQCVYAGRRCVRGGLISQKPHTAFRPSPTRGVCFARIYIPCGSKKSDIGISLFSPPELMYGIMEKESALCVGVWGSPGDWVRRSRKCSYSSMRYEEPTANYFPIYGYTVSDDRKDTPNEKHGSPSSLSLSKKMFGYSSNLLHGPYSSPPIPLLSLNRVYDISCAIQQYHHTSFASIVARDGES